MKGEEAAPGRGNRTVKQASHSFGRGGREGLEQALLGRPATAWPFQTAAVLSPRMQAVRGTISGEANSLQPKATRKQHQIDDQPSLLGAGW